jgi:ubiquinone/menaquinone biosynthesis C-methylase UbiE
MLYYGIATPTGVAGVKIGRHINAVPGYPSLKDVSMPLARTLEPETMCSERDALQYESIDHAGANAAFVDSITIELGFKYGKLLDLGTGPGDIPVEICRRIEDAQVTAVEMSPVMMSLAAKKMERAGFSNRITLLQADAKATKLPDGSFDFVICNNLIHHIPEPGLIFREIARLCRPGGGVFLKDLRRPDTLAQLNALAGRRAESTLRQRELLVNSLHAALRAEEIEIYARQAGLTEFTLAEIMPRHWELRRPVN